MYFVDTTTVAHESLNEINGGNKMDESNNLPSEELHEETDSLSQFFGTAREVLARYTHCALCGANLHFTHITDFSKNLTQETSRCPECGIRARRLIHRLQ
jgi:hypothetical protein